MSGFIPCNGIEFLLYGISGRVYVTINDREVLNVLFVGPPDQKRISVATMMAMDFVKFCAGVEKEKSINLLDPEMKA